MEDIIVTGPLLLLDIFSEGLNVKKVKLPDIPQLLTLQSTQRKYKLEGFVSYIQRRSVISEQENAAPQTLNTSVQHYTAVLLHENGQWTEIDDLTATETAIKNKQVVPHLMIYSQI